MAVKRVASGGQRAPKLKAAGDAGSSAIRQAASVLESELAAGLAGVRRVEAGIRSERRVEQKDFDEVLQRFRTNAHEVIDLSAARVADLRTDDVQDLTSRLTNDAHDLFDAMISMVGMAPEILNRLAARAETAFPTPPPTKAPKREASARKTTPRAGT